MAAPKQGTVLAAGLVAALLAVFATLAVSQTRPAHGVMPHGLAPRVRPPPPSGYFTLQPARGYLWLQSDAAAARQVHWSNWEPRPGNTRYNRTIPARLALRGEDVADRAYDPRWNKYILRRITGHFSGTTDEIFQWAAAKWGLPDNLIRTIAFMESGWRQANYGDLVYDSADCPRGYTRLPCPVTFGIVGTKTTSWPGIFPWNRDSTAAGVDVLGGWLRGCYEGWVWWLRDHGNRSRGVYRAHDIWGCVGAWYSGNWHDGSISDPNSGESYISAAHHWYAVRPWLNRHFAVGDGA